jgi:hypothetical protein
MPPQTRAAKRARMLEIREQAVGIVLSSGCLHWYEADGQGGRNLPGPAARVAGTKESNLPASIGVIATSQERLDDEHCLPLVRCCCWWWKRMSLQFYIGQDVIGASRPSI